jgi:hypothetical protein
MPQSSSLTGSVPAPNSSRSTSDAVGFPKYAKISSLRGKGTQGLLLLFLIFNIHINGVKDRYRLFSRWNIEALIFIRT